MHEHTCTVNIDPETFTNFMLQPFYHVSLKLFLVPGFDLENKMFKSEIGKTLEICQRNEILSF